jgi:DNA-binding CsgD family transcriptional regulator
VIRLKNSERHQPSSNGHSFHPKLFVFFDKSTGERRFEVKAEHDGSLPVDKATSLLAVHCVARHQVPGDFAVLPSIDGDVIDGLVGCATRLIKCCSHPAAAGKPLLSRRQNEVLIGVTENLTNKEIALRLNLSERTVKFHVSALLEKFRVRSRVDLLLEVGGFSGEVVHKRERKPQVPLAGASNLIPAFPSAGVITAPLIPLQTRSGR